MRPYTSVLAYLQFGGESNLTREASRRSCSEDGISRLIRSTGKHMRDYTTLLLSNVQSILN